MIVPGVEILNVQSVVSPSDYIPAIICVCISMIILSIMSVLDDNDILDGAHTIVGLFTVIILICGGFYGFYHAPRVEMQARIKDTDTFMEVYKYYNVTNIDGDIFTLTERL